MKLVCPRKEFFEAVSAAAVAASTRTSVNILQYLKIEGTDTSMRVLGCDGEMWVERQLACFVTEPGSICVEAKLLHSLVQTMPDGDIELSTQDKGTVLVQQGASEYTMMTLDAEDFPEPPGYGGEGELKLQMGLLRNAVDSVIFAVTPEQHKAVLTGVLFSYNGRMLTLVATDTHRLAVRKIEQEGIGSNINAVVPEKALRSIKGLPILEDQEVEIKFGSGRLGVSANGATVVSQLLSGTYPNWERVVPAESTRSWCVEVDQLRDKVKRAMLLARENANRVRFKGDGDQILLEARSEERGEAKEEVAMISQNGDVEIAFNGKYVQDALGPIVGEGVRIEMTESTRPAVFRPVDEGTDYFCVIMPMALA